MDQFGLFLGQSEVTPKLLGRSLTKLFQKEPPT